MTLRVSALDGRVSITAPSHVPMRDIEAFVLEKEAWLQDKVSAMPEPVPVTFYTAIPIHGMLHDIVPFGGNRMEISKNHLYIPEKIKLPNAITVAFLKILARDQIIQEADFYALKLGLPYAKISLRDVKSRWGSCNDQGAMMFSWRLIMAPPKVLTYVVAHEVAHLRHMNHSNQFWNELRSLLGEYREEKQWLRENGATLHKYKFKD
ncbi:MAG: SprT family zinc-dependent metalloprotease [Paracoccaceae bacterium]|nr:SprT family zinc-dependent metalloprotease [Paracoccaceae bacterium]